MIAAVYAYLNKADNDLNGVLTDWLARTDDNSTRRGPGQIDRGFFVRMNN